MDKHKWYFMPAIAVLALIGLYLSGYLTCDCSRNETMRLRQIAAVAAVAAGMGGCELLQETIAAEQTQITVSTVKQAAPVTSKNYAEPKVAAVSVSNVQLQSSYAQCLNAAGGITWSMQDCIEKEWRYQDARLNAAYQKLKAKLPKAQWGQLRTEQREWIIDKDHSEFCKWDAATEGQSQRIAANECTLLQVAIRADKLEKLLAR